MDKIYTLLWCSACFIAAGAIPETLLYDYKLSKVLPRGDDISSREISLKIPIVFYGAIYRSIFINANGFLSFQTEIPFFFNIEFPLDYPIIAPFYSNVDTTGAGEISYFETADKSSISRASKTVRDAFSYMQEFNALSIFIVTWSDVGYHLNGTDKLNTFQVAIYSDGVDSFVEYLYPENGLQWIQGTGDDSGLPDARAQAGFISVDGRFFILPGSGTDQVRYLDKRSNMDLPGQWLYRVGDLDVDENVDQPDRYNSKSVEKFVPTKCAMATAHCHVQAKCIDYEEGFCCVCKKNYYGNGKSCIKRDVPLRVNGKVRASLNGEHVENLDLQSYIVMLDGRAYTAMSKIPESIGYDIQSLQILGATIGWVFAKPVGESLNGFQLTGGFFNHTTTITFPNTNQKVTIRQKYLGLDVFDQLKLESDINGEIPNLPVESKITLDEYQEQYTLTAPGVLQSASSHTFLYSQLDEEIEVPYSIEQSIVFEYCKYSQLPIGTTWKLKVGKNFISYESREQIIRYGMSNKIGPIGDVDPCEVGRTTCGPHSSCVVEDDSYRCVCNLGYQQIYRSGEESCEDVNECTQGVHECDYNAQCVNQVGHYYCICNPGFEGNGRVCENAKSCDNVTCTENAECVMNYNIAMCSCQPGFSGNGQLCTPIVSQSCNVANNCSPYGFCSINPDDKVYYCHCLPDYEGDGYDCTAKATTESELEVTEPIPEETTIVPDGKLYVTERCVLGVCWCPDGYVKDTSSRHCIRTDPDVSLEKPEEAQAAPEVQCFNSTLCFCPRGYSLKQKSCVSKLNETLTKGQSGVTYSCHDLNNCSPDGQCLFLNNGHYQCFCRPGFEGDGRECNELDVTCSMNDICDIHSSCNYDEDFGKSICVCNEGYQGDGTSCVPIPICASDEDCLENEVCRYTQLTEGYDCVCKEGLIRDSQHLCVKVEGTCGGGKCVDNAECLFDEEYQTYYCSCKKEFIGDGIRECKPRPIGCNIINNCGLHATCSYSYQTRLHECKCTEGFYGDGFICYTEKNCHIDPSMCHPRATCVTDANRRYTCQCISGFSGNGSVCHMTPKHEGNFLLVNQGIATLKMPYDSAKKGEGRPIQMKPYQLAVGLDVDCFGGRFYWSDISLKAIRSASYNGSNKEDFITKDIISPEGIAIDWVSRNMYWTDSTRDTIEVANLESKLRRTLFDKKLVNPRGIAVHPQRGKIFWSDWDRAKPKIEWANSDGSGREIFLQGESVQLPNSLTIDFFTEQLCYADAGIKKIVCVDIDSREPHVMATNCTYPFGIAATGDHIYWSDWISKTIERVEKYTTKRLPPLKLPLGGTGNKLYAVVSVPDRCHQLSNVCMYYKDQCPNNYICLPDGKGSRKCLCGNKIDSADKNDCNDL